MWSSKIPDQPGYYWVGHSGDVFIVDVQRGIIGNLFLLMFGTDAVYRLDEIDSWGPRISMPELE